MKKEEVKFCSFNISCLYLVIQSHYDVGNSIIVPRAMDTYLAFDTYKAHTYIVNFEEIWFTVFTNISRSYVLTLAGTCHSAILHGTGGGGVCDPLVFGS